MLARSPAAVFHQGSSVPRTRRLKSAVDELEDADIISDQAGRLRDDSDAGEGGSLPFDVGRPTEHGGGDPILEDLPYDDIERPVPEPYLGPRGGRPYEDPEDEPAGGDLRPPAEPPAQDTTPWKGLASKAQKLILAVSILILAVETFAKSFFGRIIAIGLAAAAVGMAGAIVAMGMVIMAKHGQTLMGGMLAVTGAFLMFSAIKALRGLLSEKPGSGVESRLKKFGKWIKKKLGFKGGSNAPTPSIGRSDLW